MKKIAAIVLLGIFSWAFGTRSGGSGVEAGIIALGSQPQIDMDNRGIIRLVFGRKDSIFCATSVDRGITFSKPVFVARVPNMHLGMSRGPQLASSDNYSIITAADKSGNIHWFQLNHLSKKSKESKGSEEWRNRGTINDTPGSGPEGLMSIAADKDDHFYAVWLDIRTGRQNEIYFSSLTGNADHWSKNVLAYKSPDGHVCECCKPAISVGGSGVAIMFRNWLHGSRDLYLLASSDKGRSFKTAQKVGTGTWKLNGCPMDGGGVFIDRSNTVHTTWQREGVVYYCKPGEMETEIGRGRTCSITGDVGNAVISMQTGDTVKLLKLSQKLKVIVGMGSFLKSIPLPDNSILCVWEQDKVVKFRKV